MYRIYNESIFQLTSPVFHRHRATLEVKAHVKTAARELSLEWFAKFENELYQVLITGRLTHLFAPPY